MRYGILFERTVLAKDVPDLDRSVLEQIQKAIEAKLGTRPDVFGKPLRRSLKNHRTLRVGEYRVVYRIDANIVRIVAIIHRSRGYGDIASRT